MYKFCDASQVLLQKVVAFYLKIMFRSKLPSNLSGGIMVNSKLQPAANEEIVSEVKKVCSTVEPARAIPGLNQPVTYHLFVKKDKELVREELSGEELAEHQSYDLYQVNDTISKVCIINWGQCSEPLPSDPNVIFVCVYNYMSYTGSILASKRRRSLPLRM